MSTIVSEKDLVTKGDCDINIKTMADKIDKFKDDFNSFELAITKELAELPKKMVDQLDYRYASKKTEKLVDKAIWLILATMVLSILSVVLK